MWRVLTPPLLCCRYELSQDLADRQVACLERKYGGRRARYAAVTIQRAYRRHQLTKAFRAITSSAKSEKRLSRRFELPDCWPPPAPATPAPTPVTPSQPPLPAPLTTTRSAASLNLNHSLENDSDLSDREYQSYGYLNDSTFIAEYVSPQAGFSPRHAAVYQVSRGLLRGLRRPAARARTRCVTARCAVAPLSWRLM